MQRDEYIAYLGGIRRYSPRTLEIYNDILKEFESRGEALTPSGIRNYEVYLLDDKKNSARTVDLHLSVLSGYCRYLVKKGELQSNPVRLVHRPKQEKRLPVFYRSDDIENYFADTECNCDEENLAFLLSLPPGDKTARELYERRLRRLIISILFCTGIRRSELISLKRSSINPLRRTISVRGKGDKMREIPAPDSLFREISLYLKSVDHLFGEITDAQSPLLLTPTGRELYPSFADRAVKEELGSAEGFTGRKSPHVLRHTIASELLDGGTGLNSIKEMLGHSSLAATQVYTHNTIERLKNVYEQAHPRANKNGGKNGD